MSPDIEPKKTGIMDRLMDGIFDVLPEQFKRIWEVFAGKENKSFADRLREVFMPGESQDPQALQPPAAPDLVPRVSQPGFEKWYFGANDKRIQAYGKFQAEIAYASQKFGVPIAVMLCLLCGENGKADPTACSRGASGKRLAYGLGQQINSTWDAWASGEGWDRDNPQHQLLCTAKGLKLMYDQCGSWQRAIVLYHTGAGGVPEGKVSAYKASNPGIANQMAKNNLPDTAEGYMQGAEHYYLGNSQAA